VRALSKPPAPEEVRPGEGAQGRAEPPCCGQPVPQAAGRSPSSGWEGCGQGPSQPRELL